MDAKTLFSKFSKFIELVKKPKIFISVGLVGVGGELTRRKLRERGQKKLQDKVNETAPAPVERTTSVPNEHIQLSRISREDVDLQQMQEVPLSQSLEQEILQLSPIAGETLKAWLNIESFNGLLKCDVPLQDLCRLKDNPLAMRGWVVNDGRISKQAVFTEAGKANVAPLLIFQCMAAITSQYYQHVISLRLDGMDSKINKILEMLKEDDKATLSSAYNQCIVMGGKSAFDSQDKLIVEGIINSVVKMRNKYRSMLLNIKVTQLDIQDYFWNDKKEAETKVNKFEETDYLFKLDMTLCAEFILFIALNTAIRISQYFNNDEDTEKYFNQMEFNFVDTYVDQFNKIRHDVIKYLELQEASAVLYKKELKSLKDQQLVKFNEMERKMQKITSAFNVNTTLYLKPEGEKVKAYISVSGL